MSVYLIPCNLSENSLKSILPQYVLEDIIPHISVFMVENLRTARRFLKKVDKTINIDALEFCEIGKNAKMEDIVSFLEKNAKNKDIGILSEAGCPGVADPGASVVAMAHRRGVQVIPLVGASSLLLSLMGSGFNGQSFTFHGYLPVQKSERAKTLKALENEVRGKNQTQLFIETPFRNMQLLEAILSNCHKDTKLCIASNLTDKEEFIQTKTINEWKKSLPNLHKKPTVFLLGATSC